MLPLNCSVQQYAWGKPGRESRVAKYKAASDPCFVFEPEENYAELWMGTHPKAPAKIAENDEPLTDWLQSNAVVLGTNTLEENLSLPFLFKVLSINKALSVQAHPDKNLAEKLHLERPEVYKDPNHKPEFGIALTPFEGMCDFRALPEIVEHLTKHPEFKGICGEEATDLLTSSLEASDDEQKAALKNLFSNFMNADQSLKESQLNLFLDRLAAEESAASDDSQESALRRLMLRLSRQFPGDAGCMVPLLLNYLSMEAGQGFFMGANKPHAYISGDILEIMACSDNVVRVALTPKYRDVDTLVEMLTYESGVPSIENGREIDAHTRVFSPPVYECEVDLTSVEGAETYKLRCLDSCSIVLVTSISGVVKAEAESVPDVPFLLTSRELKLGDVLFIPARVEIAILGSSDDAGVSLARAHTNPAFASGAWS